MNKSTPTGINYQESYLSTSKPGVGTNLLYMLLVSCLSWIVLAFIEYNVLYLAVNKVRMLTGVKSLVSKKVGVKVKF